MLLHSASSAKARLARSLSVAVGFPMPVRSSDERRSVIETRRPDQKAVGFVLIHVLMRECVSEGSSSRRGLDKLLAVADGLGILGGGC